MPLVAYNNLPSFQRLMDEGRNVLSAERALSQEIRELHVGLLNMMPDKALQATERQFFRLIGESTQIVQLYVHPFTLPSLTRSDETLAYIDKYYERFEDIQKAGLDALIITGANVTNPDLSQEPFWDDLRTVMDWAWDNVASTICSCLATHAVMQFRYGQKRSARAQKLWGVYPHKVVNKDHPLVRNMNTLFDVPHSRHNSISKAQFKDANMMILVESLTGGVHLVTSSDGIRMVGFQGHPEYDSSSLLKEYIRDFKLYADGETEQQPPLPENYLDAETAAKIQAGDFDVLDDINNTWTDSARAVIANWLGQVYSITNVDRTKLFMDGVDPHDPLGLKITT